MKKKPNVESLEINTLTGDSDEEWDPLKFVMVEESQAKRQKTAHPGDANVARTLQDEFDNEVWGSSEEKSKLLNNGVNNEDLDVSAEEDEDVRIVEEVNPQEDERDSDTPTQPTHPKEKRKNEVLAKLQAEPKKTHSSKKSKSKSQSTKETPEKNGDNPKKKSTPKKNEDSSSDKKLKKEKEKENHKETEKEKQEKENHKEKEKNKKTPEKMEESENEKVKDKKTPDKKKEKPASNGKSKSKSSDADLMEDFHNICERMKEVIAERDALKVENETLRKKTEKYDKLVSLVQT